MKEVNELIRGEIAAVKSIDAVLQKVKDENERSELSSIRLDHVRAVDTLKRFGSKDFEEPSDTAGPWGAFATAFTGGASLFGDKAALQALKVGEEYGIKDYQDALKDDDIDMDVKQVIRSELLPKQQGHIGVINKYLH